MTAEDASSLTAVHRWVRNGDRGARLQAFMSEGAGVVELDVVVGHQFVLDEGQGRKLLPGMLGGRRLLQ